MRSLLLAACLAACTAKDVQAGAVLLACIDDHILAGDPPEKIIAVCGPDAAPLLSQRQELARKRQPCTTIVVDGGAPSGPGR